jgi:hypothetical protein
VATTPGTFKHRHQTLLPDAGADVDAPEWNDSHVVSGGTDGQVMTRDSTQPDGWGLAAAPWSPTSGQIPFPATQIPSSNPNTLDDYEEGTFLPIITCNGGSSG